MKQHLMVLMIMFTGLFAADAWSQAPAPVVIPDRPTVTTPAGTYQTAWMELEADGAKARVSVFLALREGRPVQFWSTSHALPGGPDPRGNPRLLTDALRGQTVDQRITAEIDLRLVSIWAPITRLGAMTLTLDLQRDGERLTGGFVLRSDGSETRGRVTGTIQSADAARQRHAIAPGQDWPSFYGVGAAGRGAAYDKPLIDDIALARPLWRSEMVCLSGWGTGVDSRYKQRAAFGTLNGGSSTPVAADGRIFLFHYRPSGDVEPAGADADLLAGFKDHPIEHDQMRRYFSARADVVVTALDATTGQTLWESVWPMKQGNVQTHKWRGNNPTPAVANGVVVVADYSWGLHALDAATGELKWTRGGGGTVPKDRGAVGPVISNDVVIWCEGSKTVGLDLQTGTERWTAAKAGSARAMKVDWRERVLLVGNPLILIDPADGRELSRIAYPGGFDNKGKLDIGRGAGANLVCDGAYIVSFATDRVDRKPVGTIFAMKVSEDDQIQPAWTHDLPGTMTDGHTALCIVNGQVITGFQDIGAISIELASGKTIAHHPSFIVQSNPTFIAFGDRVLWQPECQHGRQMIQLFDVSDGKFEPMGKNWRPPHNDTTAYGEMPTNNIVIDGRLIIRGMDGIYCYDLRPAE